MKTHLDAGLAGGNGVLAEGDQELFVVFEGGDGASVDAGEPELAVRRQGNFEAALAAGREADVCLGEDASVLGNDGGEVEAADLGGEGRRDLAAGNDEGKLEIC